MRNYTSTKQITPDEFKTEFELKIAANNRWVKLSSKLPWDELVKPYLLKLSENMGAGTINARIIVGSLFIKHCYNYSDEETIKQIQENVYMQYFLGLNLYHPEPLFHPSLFTHIRYRMGGEEFDKMNIAIRKTAIDFEALNGKKGNKQNTINKGILIIDATVGDQYIKHPTDIDLLSQSRVWTERIIDEIFPQTFLEIKPRTYRKEAAEKYIKIAKSKKKTQKAIRRTIKEQLGYVKRNLGHIDTMLEMFEEGSFSLEKESQKYLSVIREVYCQQKYMYDNHTNKCENRIVSLHQPHVRPIVRGKEREPVEFGAKLSVSLENGFARIDRLSWDAFNECADLIPQVEAYKSIHGYYPEAVLSDKIYHTKANRKWLEERGIRHSGIPLEKPSQEKESAYQKKKRKKERNKRNQIEGKFGQGKTRYNLNKITAKTKPTSESMINAIVFTMNLKNFQQKYC